MRYGGFEMLYFWYAGFEFQKAWGKGGMQDWAIPQVQKCILTGMPSFYSIAIGHI